MNGKYFKNKYLISIIFVYYAISGKKVFLKQQKVHKALQIMAMAPHQTYFIFTVSCQQMTIRTPIHPIYPT